MALVAPLVFGFRRGVLRQWARLLWVAVAAAMALLGEGAGLFAGLLVLGYCYHTRPSRYGAVLYFPVSAAVNAAPRTPQLPAPTPCLWLDSQRVVLGSPYRVIYRDELRPADFARLRRLCRGLPA